MKTLPSLPPPSMGASGGGEFDRMGRGLRCTIPIVYFLYTQFIYSLLYTAQRQKLLFSKFYDIFKTNWHKPYHLSFILSTKTFLTVAWNLRYSGLKLQITNPHFF